MPRIEDIKIKKFKKNSVRSWDGDLFEKLKLPSHEDFGDKKNSNNQDPIRVQNESKSVAIKSSESPINVDNSNSNKTQLGFKQDPIKVQNRVQINDLKDQKDKETWGNEDLDRVQIRVQEFKQGSNRVQLGFKQGSIRVQNRVQLNPISSFSEEQNFDQNSTKKLISKLTGNEYKIFFFIIKQCSENSSLSIEKIKGSQLDEILSIPRNSRETSLKRLIKKNLIHREKGKPGKNGILNLRVSEKVKMEALSCLNLDINNANKFEAELGFKLGFKNPYSSSYIYNINKTTTTRSEITTKGKLDVDWQEIDFSDLEQIGFSENHLKQLASNENLSAELVQDSINHFAFGLAHNDKIKKYDQPLSVLIGVLRKGQAWIEPNYTSKQELAQKQLLELRKAEQERMSKMKEQAYELAFQDWLAELPEDKVEQIAPQKRPRGDLMPQKVKLSKYFRENFWQQLKSRYLVSE